MEKWEENTQIGHFGCHVPVQFRYWSFLANLYRYKLDMYRYNCCSVPSFDQFLYFGHNLLIAYPI